MLVTQKDFWQNFNKLLTNRVSFVVVTLVEAYGSVPQELGAKMIVGVEGLLAGTIGGGTLEAKAIAEATQMFSAEKNIYLKKVDLAQDLKMACGGQTTLLFECFRQNNWEIAVFGAGHVAQNLVPILLNLNASVTCIDTRQEWLARLPNDDGLKKICSSELVTVPQQLKNNSFIIIMTHDHQFDFVVLQACLNAKQFPYIGVMGSRSKRQALDSFLRENNFSQSVIDTIYCPIGLPIGSNEPQEIAISIVAQLLQLRDSQKMQLNRPVAGAQNSL